MGDDPPSDDQRPSPAEAPVDAAYEQFLLEEGLDMLALFRAIAEPSIRRRFVTMMKTISAAELAGAV